MWVNDWHDLVRVTVICMAVVCLVVLGRRFGKQGADYNTKTRDLWFVIVLWSLTAVVLAFEGMIEDRPLEPRLIFYTLATSITLKALLNKSDWGASR